MKLQWPWNGTRWKEFLLRYRYVLLVVAVGLGLMLLPTGKETGPPQQEGTESSFSLEKFEDRLTRAISNIEGAGEAQVVLTLEGEGRQVLARDTTQGQDGEQSVSTVTVNRGSGSQGVVAVENLSPSFRGALVVCPGGDDPAIQWKILQAVSALTGLGSDRICVCGGGNS